MVNDQFQINSTRTEDADAILAIAHDAGVFDTEEVVTVNELLRDFFTLGSQGSGYYFLSCRVSERVVGFACYGPHPLTHGTFDLYWIATEQAMRGHGIGGALLERVVNDVRALGGRLLVVETSGRADYAPTRHFYETHRCSHAATVPDFYAPGDDLIIYVQRV